MSKPKATDLGAVREQIDAIDAQLHQLLNERARLAQQVGISKTSTGSMVDFYRPEREAQVLRLVKERNQGPLRTEDLLRLFREIMSACLAQQEPLKVAFLGPEGTFTQTAVLTHFGHAVRALPLPSVDEVFHEVEAATVDFGVVAIENSTEGSGSARTACPKCVSTAVCVNVPSGPRNATFSGSCCARHADMISRNSRSRSSVRSGPWLRSLTRRSTCASRSGR